MLYAKELATAGNVQSVTTVSRRGRPAAPGPAAAFLSVMAQETTHYMAACDVADAKAVECLTEWSAPSEQQLYDDQSWSWGGWLEQTKAELPNMSAGQVNSTIQYLQDARGQLQNTLREVKSRLQHVRQAPREKDDLEAQVLELKEQEALALELLADARARLNELTA